MVPLKSWDEIKLPEDVGNQPADINLNPDEGDPGVVSDPEPKAEAPSGPAGSDPKPQDPKPAPETENPPKAEENKNDPPKAEEPAPAADPEPKPEVKKVETPAPGAATGEGTPDPTKAGFHTHPDWQKMEAEKREAELKAARLEGRIEAMEKQQTNTPADIKTARQRINEMIDSGEFKPESQLDLLTKYDELKEAERKERADAAEKTLNEAKQRITNTLNTTYSELQVSDDKDRKVIEDQVEAWRKEGVVSIAPDLSNLSQVIKHAHQTLKDKGLIGKLPAAAPAPAPSTDPAAEAAAKKAAEERARVNGTINKPANSDGGAQPPQRTFKTYAELHGQDMDTRTAKAATRLG